MQDTTLKMTILHDPTSSKDGKFYIGVQDDRLPITLHGPKKKNTAGTMNTPGNALSVSKKITEKLRGGYKLALLSDMPTPALKKLKDQVCTSLGITDPNTIQLFDDLIIVGQQAGSAAPTKKPKRRKTKQIAVWL